MNKLRYYQKQSIAHEVIFPPNVVKNFVNCVKFVTQVYLYYKELSANQYAKKVNRNHPLIYREFYVSTTSNRTINETLLLEFCKEFNLDINRIYLIAKHFQNTDHNILILNIDLSKVKFYYGNKQSFAEVA